MKKLFYLLFLISFKLCAQDSLYSRVISNPMENFRSFSSVNSSDSGLVVSGMHSDASMPSANALICRLDSLANPVWIRSIGDVNHTNYMTAVCAIPDGSFVGAVNDENRAVCVKFNSSGDTLWTKSVEASGISDGINEIHMTATSDSSVVMVWGQGYNSRWTVVKIDAMGQVEWSASYELPATNNSINIPRALREASDSSIYIGGKFDNTRGGLMKINASGQLLWFKSTGSEAIEDLEFSGDTLFVVFNGLGIDLFIARMDTSATIDWAYSYPFYHGGFWYIRTDLIVAEDSTLLVHIGNDSYSFNSAARIDQNGNLLYSSMVDLGGHSVLPAANNGVFLVGSGPVYGLKQGESQIVVVRANDSLVGTFCSDPTISGSTGPANITFTDESLPLTNPVIEGISSLQVSALNLTFSDGCAEVIGGIDEEERSGILIYPTVSDGIFKLSNPEGLKGTLSILDELGRPVITVQMTAQDSDFDLSRFSEGMYWYTFESDQFSQDPQIGRIIISK